MTCSRCRRCDRPRRGRALEALEGPSGLIAACGSGYRRRFNVFSGVPFFSFCVSRFPALA
ncbi:hypothetical protein C4K09_0971 [Pseudomonas chlororaphis subsp. aureofaciens]|nr:hypothetical protein C4K09_0971 [Pseudomonas chlororaphis subsp. aureofaciens]